MAKINGLKPMCRILKVLQKDLSNLSPSNQKYLAKGFGTKFLYSLKYIPVLTKNLIFPVKYSHLYKSARLGRSSSPALTCPNATLLA